MDLVTQSGPGLGPAGRCRLPGFFTGFFTCPGPLHPALSLLIHMKS